jgi:putative addiction module component (TIGR02574 family)
MPQMTPKVSEVLAEAMQLSPQERELLIDRLVESLDEGPAEAGTEEAWGDEIKRRVDEIRSGKVKMIPGEQVLQELAEDFPDDSLNVNAEC